MSDIIKISVEDLAERQSRTPKGSAVPHMIGGIVYLTILSNRKLIDYMGRSGELIMSPDNMRGLILNKRLVVFPINIHKKDGKVFGVSVPDEPCSPDSLPEVIIYAEKSEGKELFNAKRFDKRTRTKIVEALRLELELTVLRGVSAKYCENPNADVQILKKLVPHPEYYHAMHYGRNKNPHKDFLDLFDHDCMRTFAVSFGMNPHVSVAQYRDILNHMAQKVGDPIVNSLAYGYMQRSPHNIKFLEELFRHPGADVSRLAKSYRELRHNRDLNDAFLKRLDSLLVFS